MILPDLGIVDESTVEFDVVVLTVKAYSVEGAVSDIRHLLRPGGTVIALQNGVGSDSTLIDAFGSEHVVEVTSTLAVSLEGPIIREYKAKGGWAWACGGPEAHAEATASVLLRTCLPLRAVGSVPTLRWSKLLLNAVGGAQSAILQVGVDVIVGDPRLFAVERNAFRETLSVMKGAGIKPVDLPGYPVRLAAFCMCLPPFIARQVLGSRMAAGRGTKKPGLVTDVERGGPTENAFLNGATVTLGRKLGIPTPVNQKLTELVDEVTISHQARNRFERNPEAFLEELGKQS